MPWPRSRPLLRPRWRPTLTYTEEPDAQAAPTFASGQAGGFGSMQPAASSANPACEPQPQSSSDAVAESQPKPQPADDEEELKAFHAMLLILFGMASIAPDVPWCAQIVRYLKGPVGSILAQATLAFTCGMLIGSIVTSKAIMRKISSTNGGKAGCEQQPGIADFVVDQATSTATAAGAPQLPVGKEGACFQDARSDEHQPGKRWKFSLVCITAAAAVVMGISSSIVAIVTVAAQFAQFIASC